MWFCVESEYRPFPEVELNVHVHGVLLKPTTDMPTRLQGIVFSIALATSYEKCINRVQLLIHIKNFVDLFLARTMYVLLHWD